MTNKLVVIINSLKVPKIKKILLYGMKFLVPNYGCLQSPWIWDCRPQIPFLSVLPPQLNLLTPSRTKFLGTPLVIQEEKLNVTACRCLFWSLEVCVRILEVDVDLTPCSLVDTLTLLRENRCVCLLWFSFVLRVDDNSRALHPRGKAGARVQLKCDGTRWRTGGEVKGKLANGVGSQYPSHYLGTWCIQHYYRWCAHLGCQ